MILEYYKINSMHLAKSDIINLDKSNRINLMNSITGIKPVVLVGTKSSENITNLAIFSSFVHISSKPALLAFFIRNNKKVRRDTFENISENGVFTLNHIHSSIISQAHRTSIKYDKNVSEFASCKFTEHYIKGFNAPFVIESNVKIGMKLKEVIDIRSSYSKLIIGEVEHVLIKKEFLNNDFSLNLEKSESVGITGLNNYYSNKHIMSLPYFPSIKIS